MFFARSKRQPTGDNASNAVARGREALPSLARSPRSTSPVVETFSVQRPQESMVNQYVLLSELGSGAYGKVVKVQNRDDGKEYACKIISKSRLRKKHLWRTRSPSRASSPSSSRPSSPVGGVSASRGAADRNGGDAGNASFEFLAEIKQEIAILKKVSRCHANITSLVEVLDDNAEDSLYLVFEICDKGPIMMLLPDCAAVPYSEAVAQKYFREIVLGLEFLHFQRIIHRDLKPENILLTADDVAQISDFGISDLCDIGREDNTAPRTASPAFMPPEAFDSGVLHVRGKAWDVWSLGITLFSLLHGAMPFLALSPPKLIQQIRQDEPYYASTLSRPCVGLLRKMLVKDPIKRITLLEIKEHSWTTTNGSRPMISTVDNCDVWEDVTQAEIENAVVPADSFFTRFLHKLRERRNSGTRSPPPGIASTTTSPPYSRPSSPSHDQVPLPDVFFARLLLSSASRLRAASGSITRPSSPVYDSKMETLAEDEPVEQHYSPRCSEPHHDSGWSMLSNN